jgi:glycosyltransferase involved in cell wall biosynthesis
MCIVPTSQAVFVHFAGWNSIFPLLIARMFRKHSVLFVHGTDCVGFPSIGYGNFRKWPLARVTCLSLRLARKVVAVDDSLISSVNTYATVPPSHQGIKHYCKGLKTPTMVLPHGFEPDDWPIGNGERDVDVLTVGVGLGEEWRRKLKGVDLLISAAYEFPQRKFVVIGIPQGAIVDLPPNVETYSEVPPSELRGWYQRSVCYVQVSMSEGFGCALAEAMLSGCIPVVSDVGAMPTIVGGAGHIVECRSASALGTALRDALRPEEMNVRASAARDRVVTKYGTGSRKILLADLLGV